MMLIFTLVVGTLLMRLNDPKMSLGWPAVIYVSYISGTVLVCWFIHASLKIWKPVKLPTIASTWLSIITGTAAALAVGYIIANSVPEGLLFEDMWPHHNVADLFKRIFGSFFLSMICYMIFNNQFTQLVLQKTKLENEQLKQAHLQAQLIALQQQLSPHFLFNSLSTLKTMAADPDTKKFVVQLSHVYRYLLTNNERQVTTLAQEIAFVNAYLYIQEQRFDSALHVSLQIPEAYMDAAIPPLSLQLLIENAIKHNAFSREEPLLVAIHVNSNDELVVSNSYRPKMSAAESTGLGLQNIKERFQLLFNKGIVIDKLHGSFTVKLPLTIHEVSYH